jgi:hypothetical protein
MIDQRSFWDLPAHALTGLFLTGPPALFISLPTTLSHGELSSPRFVHFLSDNRVIKTAIIAFYPPPQSHIAHLPPGANVATQLGETSQSDVIVGE